MGRLYGAEERVLERVVTYLVSAAEYGIRFTQYRIIKAQTHSWWNRDTPMGYAYQCSLAGALYTVEANKEWRWLFAF